MKSIAKRLPSFAERAIGCVVFIVGLRTIMDYADRNYPRTYAVISGVLLLGILVWFFIKYLAIPFVEGLRGARTTEKTARAATRLSRRLAPEQSGCTSRAQAQTSLARGGW